MPWSGRVGQLKQTPAFLHRTKQNTSWNRGNSTGLSKGQCSRFCCMTCQGSGFAFWVVFSMTLPPKKNHGSGFPFGCPFKATKKGANSKKDKPKWLVDKPAFGSVTFSFAKTTRRLLSQNACLGWMPLSLTWNHAKKEDLPFLSNKGP